MQLFHIWQMCVLAATKFVCVVVEMSNCNNSKTPWTLVGAKQEADLYHCWKLH